MYKLSRYIAKIFYFLTLSYFSSNVYAGVGYETRFDVKFENNHLYFNIKLDYGYKIYGNEAGDTGLPTKISLDPSQNLRKWQVVWPVPEKEYYHGTMYHYIYQGNISIPVHLEIANVSDPVMVKGLITYAICKEQCVPVTQEIEVDLGIISESNDMLWILLAAFLGGMILNFMPCVLPVLMLKIFSIISNRDAGYRSYLIATIGGIFTSFLLLGYSAFWMKSLGIKMGMGANFQTPQFVIILTIIMTVFTSNILGRLEIVLPNFISSKLATTKFKDAYISAFASGVIATIFATPCTAPFLGTAITFAMTAEFIQIMEIFSAIALGFSMPYILLIISPELLRLLPKPGAWMEIFKKLLAVAMIMTILWLLSILHSQLGLRATIGVLMLLFLIKFTFEQKQMHIALRYALAIILFTGAMYLPTTASEEDQIAINEQLELWKPFDQKLLERSIAEGKIVIVDITADWCMTCKYNKFMLWNRSNTVKLLTDPDIIAMRGDLTRPSHMIHLYLEAMGVYGIPFDIVYGPSAKHGIVLPTIVGYEDLVKAVERAQKNLIQ